MINQTQQPVIACTPEGVPAEKRARWIEVGKQVYNTVDEVRELPDGYACRLPKTAAMLITAAEYVSLDSLCCTFLRWSLVIEPYGEHLWLQLTGGAGVKEYLRLGFETADLLTEQVAQAAGFSIASRTVIVDTANPDLSVARFEEAIKPAS